MRLFAAAIQTPLVQRGHSAAAGRRAEYLLAGTVIPSVLVHAATALLTDLQGQTPMIVTRALTKRFGRFARRGPGDLDVRDGDRYGFLGPNGSGKTTVVRMLLVWCTPPAARSRSWASRCPARPAEVLPHIGALVEGPSS